uniref:Aegyptin/gSG7 salivary protein-like four-helix bundle domain-containing protein n=1 Tax=Anopheles christyi TaxID=43041 RepID=A0A182KC37_9DIPT
MKSLLLLASVLCLALIISGRPTDETTDQESSTELSEDTSADYEQEEGEAGTGSDTETEDGAAESDSGAEADDGGETDGDAGEMASSPEDGEGTDDDTVSGADEDTEGAKDDESGDNDGDEGEGGSDASGGEEESPRNTYRQVHKLLKKIMKVDTKDKYLKSFVVGRLQERLMNPTIDLVSTIEKYSKIKECFSSLEKDVSALVKESDKSYEECSKDKSNTDCGTQGTRDLDDGLIEREQELSDCIVDKRDAE